MVIELCENGPSIPILREQSHPDSNKRRRTESQHSFYNITAPKRHRTSPSHIESSHTEVIDLTEDDYSTESHLPADVPCQALGYADRYPLSVPTRVYTPEKIFEIGPCSPPDSSLDQFAGSFHSDLAKKQPSPHEPNVPNVSISDVVPITEPVLCKEQHDLVDLIISGRNVFYTGSAGCGKSTVLKHFVRRFQEMGRHVDIIAPTGRAALDINGSTTWTYAGWTPDSHKKPLAELLKGAHGKFVNKRLNKTGVLVIDEISMVESDHFARINALMKEARNNENAFGGVQLVVTGDFCQLPPVKPFRHCITCGRELIPIKAGAEYKCPQHGIYYDIDKWAFRSQAWKDCNFVHVNLTNIHRQSDSVFINLLQKLRMGKLLLPLETDILLNHHSETRNAVKLFATRAEVKRVNDEMFAKLRTKARPFHCLDYFRWSEKHRNLEFKNERMPDGSLKALNDHRFDAHIQLKKGMLVVLLANLDISVGLVNGSQGTIQGFEVYDKTKMPRASETSRKSRQRELDSVVSGVPVLAGEHAQLREDQIKQYINGAEYKAWPVVTFLNGVTRTIYADCTVNELGDEKPHSLLCRTQIPLMAAWAITMHKSQGMTLNRVIVDLSKSFEQGQAYVAREYMSTTRKMVRLMGNLVSRARSLDGLKVVSFPKSAQGTGNEQVKEFLRAKFDIM